MKFYMAKKISKAKVFKFEGKLGIEIKKKTLVKKTLVIEWSVEI